MPVGSNNTKKTSLAKTTAKKGGGGKGKGGGVPKTNKNNGGSLRKGGSGTGSGAGRGKGGSATLDDNTKFYNLQSYKTFVRRCCVKEQHQVLEAKLVSFHEAHPPLSGSAKEAFFGQFLATINPKFRKYPGESGKMSAAERVLCTIYCSKTLQVFMEEFRHEEPPEKAKKDVTEHTLNQFKKMLDSNLDQIRSFAHTCYDYCVEDINNRKHNMDLQNKALESKGGDGGGGDRWDYWDNYDKGKGRGGKGGKYHQNYDSNNNNNSNLNYDDSLRSESNNANKQMKPVLSEFSTSLIDDYMTYFLRTHGRDAQQGALGLSMVVNDMQAATFISGTLTQYKCGGIGSVNWDCYEKFPNTRAELEQLFKFDEELKRKREVSNSRLRSAKEFADHTLKQLADYRKAKEENNRRTRNNAGSSSSLVNNDNNIDPDQFFTDWWSLYGVMEGVFNISTSSEEESAKKSKEKLRGKKKDEEITTPDALSSDMSKITTLHKIRQSCIKEYYHLVSAELPNLPPKYDYYLTNIKNLQVHYTSYNPESQPDSWLRSRMYSSIVYGEWCLAKNLGIMATKASTNGVINSQIQTYLDNQSTKLGDTPNGQSARHALELCKTVVNYWSMGTPFTCVESLKIALSNHQGTLWSNSLLDVGAQLVLLEYLKTCDKATAGPPDWGLNDDEQSYHTIHAQWYSNCSCLHLMEDTFLVINDWHARNAEPSLLQPVFAHKDAGRNQIQEELIDLDLEGEELKDDCDDKDDKWGQGVYGNNNWSTWDSKSNWNTKSWQGGTSSNDWSDWYPNSYDEESKSKSDPKVADDDAERDISGNSNLKSKFNKSNTADGGAEHDDSGNSNLKSNDEEVNDGSKRRWSQDWWYDHNNNNKSFNSTDELDGFFNANNAKKQNSDDYDKVNDLESDDDPDKVPSEGSLGRKRKEWGSNNNWYNLNRNNDEESPLNKFDANRSESDWNAPQKWESSSSSRGKGHNMNMAKSESNLNVNKERERNLSRLRATSEEDDEDLDPDLVYDEMDEMVTDNNQNLDSDNVYDETAGHDEDQADEEEEEADEWYDYNKVFGESDDQAGEEEEDAEEEFDYNTLSGPGLKRQKNEKRARNINDFQPAIISNQGTSNKMGSGTRRTGANRKIDSGAASSYTINTAFHASQRQSMSDNQNNAQKGGSKRQDMSDNQNNYQKGGSQRQGMNDNQNNYQKGGPDSQSQRQGMNDKQNNYQKGDSQSQRQGMNDNQDNNSNHKSKSKGGSQYGLSKFYNVDKDDKYDANLSLNRAKVGGSNNLDSSESKSNQDNSNFNHQQPQDLNSKGGRINNNPINNQGSESESAAASANKVKGGTAGRGPASSNYSNYQDKIKGGPGLLHGAAAAAGPANQNQNKLQHHTSSSSLILNKATGPGNAAANALTVGKGSSNLNHINRSSISRETKQDEIAKKYSNTQINTVTVNNNSDVNAAASAANRESKLKGGNVGTGSGNLNYQGHPSNNNKSNKGGPFPVHGAAAATRHSKNNLQKGTGNHQNQNQNPQHHQNRSSKETGNANSAAVGSNISSSDSDSDPKLNLNHGHTNNLISNPGSKLDDSEKRARLDEFAKKYSTRLVNTYISNVNVNAMLDESAKRISSNILTAATKVVNSNQEGESESEVNIQKPLPSSARVCNNTSAPNNQSNYGNISTSESNPKLNESKLDESAKNHSNSLDNTATDTDINNLDANAAAAILGNDPSAPGSAPNNQSNYGKSSASESNPKLNEPKLDESAKNHSNSLDNTATATDINNRDANLNADEPKADLDANGAAPPATGHENDALEVKDSPVICATVTISDDTDAAAPKPDQGKNLNPNQNTPTIEEQTDTTAYDNNNHDESQSYSAHATNNAANLNLKLNSNSDSTAYHGEEQILDAYEQQNGGKAADNEIHDEPQVGQKDSENIDGQNAQSDGYMIIDGQNAQSEGAGESESTNRPANSVTADQENNNNDNNFNLNLNDSESDPNGPGGLCQEGFEEKNPNMPESDSNLEGNGPAPAVESESYDNNSDVLSLGPGGQEGYQDHDGNDPDNAHANDEDTQEDEDGEGYGYDNYDNYNNNYQGQGYGNRGEGGGGY